MYCYGKRTWNTFSSQMHVFNAWSSNTIRYGGPKCPIHEFCWKRVLNVKFEHSSSEKWILRHRKPPETYFGCNFGSSSCFPTISIPENRRLLPFRPYSFLRWTSRFPLFPSQSYVKILEEFESVVKKCAIEVLHDEKLEKPASRTTHFSRTRFQRPWTGSNARNSDSTCRITPIDMFCRWLVLNFRKSHC